MRQGQPPFDNPNPADKAGCSGERRTVMAARARAGLSMHRLPTDIANAASGNVRPVDEAAETFVVGVVVAPDDVPADHAGLFFAAGVVGAVQREVPQRGELGFDAV
jgi:hypothetical protein